jgi:hypothetical protein
MGKLISGIANVFTGASDTKQAGQIAGAKQEQAAREAAIAAQFRPVGMTTAFGKSEFTREIDPATGMPYVSGATYTANPQLEALQKQLMSQYGGSSQYAADQAKQLQALSPAAQKLFGLADQYLAQSPQQAAQDWMKSQQNLLAPGQEQQLAQLRNQQFQTGRTGLATGGTTAGGMMQANPEMAAYYNSLANTNLGLASQAQQMGQEQAKFGAGLFGTGATLLGTQASTMAGAYSPLQTLLGTSGNVEQMSQMPLQLGLQIGAAQQPGQQAGAGMYQSGMNQGAQTQYGATQAANAANAQFWGGVISGVGNVGAGMAKAGAFSDIRTKENIKVIGKMKNGLNVYSFEYKKEFKDSEYAGHGKFVGVMAQEVEKIIPEAVFIGPNGYKAVNYSLIV